MQLNNPKGKIPVTSDNSSIKLFAGTDSDVFADEICTHLISKKDQGYTRKNTKGNAFVRIEEKVSGKNVYLTKSITVEHNDNFMELLF
jgi:phosphoribosylpyrophosphate synthetase